MEESSSIVEVDRWNLVEIKGYPSTVTKDDLLRLFGDAGVVLSYSLLVILVLFTGLKKKLELPWSYLITKFSKIKFSGLGLRKMPCMPTGPILMDTKKVCFVDANMEKGEPYLHELFGEIGKIKKIAMNDVKRKVFKLDGRKLMLASGVVAFEKEEHARL